MRKNVIIIIFVGMIMSSNFNPALARVVSPIPALKCVQIELNSLGFDAGNNDGILQQKTIKASKDYIEWVKNKDVDFSLPPLDIKNAQIWCDVILKNSSLKT